MACRLNADSGGKYAHVPCPLGHMDTAEDQVESLKATVIQSTGTGASLHFQGAQPDTISPFESETSIPPTLAALNACTAIREVTAVKVTVFGCNNRARVSFKCSQNWYVNQVNENSYCHEDEFATSLLFGASKHVTSKCHHRIIVMRKL